ncbi:MAG: ankyrin repeat domain-containing protein [Nitrospirae bacterium]|nr:ankyrin repeat domain-containing protein [Nitrospirota bacterium]
MKKVFSLMSFRACPGISNVLFLALLISVLFIPLSLYAGINDDLIIAAARGDIAKIKELLDKGADVNAKTNDGMTALMLAADKGHTEIVRLLENAMKKR